MIICQPSSSSSFLLCRNSCRSAWFQDPGFISLTGCRAGGGLATINIRNCRKKSCLSLNLLHLSEAARACHCPSKKTCPTDQSLSASNLWQIFLDKKHCPALELGSGSVSPPNFEDGRRQKKTLWVLSLTVQVKVLGYITHLAEISPDNECNI